MLRCSEKKMQKYSRFGWNFRKIAISFLNIHFLFRYFDGDHESKMFELKAHAKIAMLLQEWKKDVAKMLRWSLKVMNRQILLVIKKIYYKLLYRGQWLNNFSPPRHEDTKLKMQLVI